MSLADARRVLRGASARTRGDEAYRAYVAVLALLVYVGPMAVAGARALAPDAVWQRLTASGPLAGIAAGVDLLLLVGVRLGPTVGAVRPPGGYVSLVLTSTADRARALAGPFAAVLAACVLLPLGVAGDAVASRYVAGAWTAAWLLPAVAAACAGAAGTGVWLRGQARTGRSALTGLLAVASATAAAGVGLTGTPWRAAMLLAGPGGWWALASGAPGTTWAWVAVGCAVVAAAWGAAAGGVLRSLRVHDLSVQASRLGAVAAGITRGSVASASDALAGAASRGRALRLPDRATIPRRDLLGLRRTPETAAVGLGLIGAGAVLGSLATAHAWPLLPCVLGALVAYLGTHLLSGGLHAHSTHGHRDAWLGVPFAQAAVQHAVTPFVLGTAVWWVVALALRAPASLVWGPVALVLLACASVTTTHQGDMPPGLVGPMDPQLGDTGAQLRFAWLVGGPLLGVGFAGGVLALADRPGTAGAVGLAGFLLLAGLARAALDRATAR